jgi:hypothetical protein
MQQIFTLIFDIYFKINKKMHISLPIGGSGGLTGSDVPDILGKVSENENRSKITISAESKEWKIHAN